MFTKTNQNITVKTLYIFILSLYPSQYARNNSLQSNPLGVKRPQQKDIHHLDMLRKTRTPI